MRLAADARFAVLDVETTGFAAWQSDRIVEIAVVCLDPSGGEARKYVTLVNPERSVGPTRIHGIRSADVRHAPHFQDILGDVIDHLSGHIVVGHNVGFDISFLHAEATRAGYNLPEFPTLCTRNLARRFCAGLASRTLRHCCDFFGIELSDAHSAECDALATARLLQECIKLAECRGLNTLEALGCPSPIVDWPHVLASGRSLKRSEAAALREKAGVRSSVAAVQRQLEELITKKETAGLQTSVVNDPALRL
jgi:DNA polymerase III epsilon subunit-like protein